MIVRIKIGHCIKISQHLWISLWENFWFFSFSFCYCLFGMLFMMFMKQLSNMKNLFLKGGGYKKNLNWRGLLLEVGGMGGGQGCLKRGGWLFFGGGGTFQRKYEIQLNLQITWIKTVWNNAIWDVMLVNTSCVSQAF